MFGSRGIVSILSLLTILLICGSPLLGQAFLFNRADFALGTQPGGSQ